ncbi:putative ABC transporter permease protein YesP [Capsulimonas corticalis]|uniref:ABC transporter permease protein YesP n=1 Tax=Capsulimonas corticalis TaxID=2219043 RepID=A0A402D680_9BACT|nr:sugar ABC transporter permease [Capsulimonas corticalis]BDI32070.1 putative ABC transporter permease protein YesP [Capsulimonas corticalis]
MKKNLVGYAFISPWILGFLVFTAYPFLSSIYLSFTRYNIVTPAKWVGMANYRALFSGDPLFWTSLGVTFKFAIIALPVGIVVGVALALLLNLNIKGMGFYRTIFYIPSIVPIVATSTVFMWLFNPEIGLINKLLKMVGVTGPPWLQSSAWALPSLVLMSLWAVGGSMVIYLAGLKDIPAYLYEAAVIDGASPWQRLRHITLPMLSPVIFFNLVMGLIGVFQYFTEAYIMTQGGPEDSTHFYALYLFERAWRYLDMGYASAMAWVLFVIVMSLTGLAFWTQKRWVHYEG